MTWMLAEILDLSTWLQHAPQTSGPTAVAAVVILALLARVDHAPPHAILAEALGPLGGRARLLARLALAANLHAASHVQDEKYQSGNDRQHNQWVHL